MPILDYKYNGTGCFEPEDDTASFGDNMENHWDYFAKNHIVRGENDKKTILYEDRDKRRGLISGKDHYPL